MVVDDGIDRHQFDRLFHLHHRLVVAAKPVETPAEAVDDRAVVGPFGRRLLDHLQRIVEVFVAVDIGITKVVQHRGLIGIKLKRGLEIGLGPGPVLPPFLADAPREIKAPIDLRLPLDAGDGLVIGLCRLIEPLLAPERIAQRVPDLDPVGVVLRQPPQHLDRGIGVARGDQRARAAQFRLKIGRVVAADLVEFGAGQGVLPLPFQDACHQQDRIGIHRGEVFRHASIGERIYVGIFRPKRAGHGVEDLGNAVLRPGDQREGNRFARLKPGAQRPDGGVAFRPERGVQQGYGVGIPLKLAQDLGMGQNAVPGRAQRPAIGPGKDRVRALEIADRGQRQRLVVKAKGFQPSHRADLVKLGGRL